MFRKSNKIWLWLLLGIFIVTMSLIIAKNSSAATISDCEQANFAPDSLVKNGHTIDADDLYTRHMECKGDKSPATFGEIVKKIIHKAHNTDSTVNSSGGGGGSSGGGSATKSCHNKNDGKDNNPTDCNAGKGNDNKP